MIGQYTLSDYRNLLRISQTRHLVVPRVSEKTRLQSALDLLWNNERWKKHLNIVIDSAQSFIGSEYSEPNDVRSVIKELFDTVKDSLCAKKLMGFMDYDFQKFRSNEISSNQAVACKNAWELMGQMAHYQSEIELFESKWKCSLEELETRYNLKGSEDFESDDDYLQWQWYHEAVQAIKPQIYELLNS